MLNTNALVKKKVVVHGKSGDYMAFRNTKTNEDIRIPREKKIDQAKHDRNKINYQKEISEKEKIEIKQREIRHKNFEEEIKEQRRLYGSGPKIPKPGLIMRVYAKNKVNVGGMLAKVKEVAKDGKTVLCELTSGKTYTIPIEHLQIAKSKIHSDN
ncbi:hypothetical protein LEP1GSC132_2473 [Leptospira kirschneri str. 200803703]|uniref:hypothetical protein n=1 Tax=Leptospira kirschneri TaxID=29507 RepID=UPI0002BEA16A|nr:hypothetical protein [Leptospira kirschneri]EMO66441.1 hypothetical protein LEP1GSC132_2473 [Leptospira kirschneri str. 200803703]